MERLGPAELEVVSNHTSSAYITELAGRTGTPYEELLADIWVGVLLLLMLLSCICCTCTCLIYHKFQKWKRLVLQDSDPEILTGEIDSSTYDCDSLPSYTVASGLPSYEEAIKQLECAKKVRTPTAYNPQLATSPSRVSLMSCIHTVVDEKS